MYAKSKLTRIRRLTYAPLYIPNQTLHKYLYVKTIEEDKL